MAGFPFFQLDRFLKILVQDLHKYVAISEEFPASLSGKIKSGGLLFERRVNRVVTPGTLIDEKFIDPYENNFLLSVHVDQQQQQNNTWQETKPTAAHGVGLAWLDLSTGDFFTQTTTIALLPSAVTRIGAREIILSPTLPEAQKHEIHALTGSGLHIITLHKCETEYRSMSEWGAMLEAPVAQSYENTFTNEEKVAGHQLLDYVGSRLQGLEIRLQPPSRKILQESLVIDRNSIRGLEILETSRDSLGKGSLLHAVRRTATKSGARLLRSRLISPAASLEEINRRLDIVTHFVCDVQSRESIVGLLQRSHDAQRIVQKFSLNRGDADDLICLARAVQASQQVREHLERKTRELHFGDIDRRLRPGSVSLSLLISRLELHGPIAVARSIINAVDEDGLSRRHRLEEEEAAGVAALAQEVLLNDTLPDEDITIPKKARSQKDSVDSIEDGDEVEDTWIMRTSANEVLSKFHEDLNVLRGEKNKLAQDLRDQTKAPSLTLKWTPGLGHICHVKGSTRMSLESLNARIVSSTKSTRSFYLTPWSQLGGRIDQAKIHIRTEEQRIFSHLRRLVIENLVPLRRNAAILDELDVACSFANLAQEQSLVRPILNLGTTHNIVGGRHPTVKLGLEEQGRSFVTNNLFLGEQERIWLVTGPNMAGKSTFLRQNALISILAQVGSYVPADHAEIGIVDQIFSRIGAADDLFRDQSTFMVEMLETASILKHATARSFVIMDEVGRGTTPEDGTAVGFACLHHLYHVNKCRTLFATHFHALADMTQEFAQLGRYCTDILEDGTGAFFFVHRLKPGVNRKSHALKVARLAGLPESAIKVATDVLKELVDEKERLSTNGRARP